jgi:predicted AAA+ superfamily ATPase
VFLELKRKQTINPDLEIYYWKDEHHREIDFIIKENLKINQLIQVSWQPELPKIKNRETRILFKAMEEFNLKESLVITEDYEKEEIYKGKTIKYIPLWKWLLLE